ncbi:hypothetical protein AURDEDRAFT_170273 [Auricularia subglabra TFB-10046 SS5]|nr:hypothetical protein AURDEDRAFT_170273 [Auricularia subglabra TFB-10046 SS5]
MPVFAFTVGSLGDIAAMLQLAWQISSTLANTGSTSAELKELIADVDLFTRALREVQAFVDRPNGHPRADVARGIQHSLDACHSILLVIHGRINAFRERMTGRDGPGSAALLMYWNVVAWDILGGRKAVDALRSRMRDHILLIQTYVSLAQSQSYEEIGAAAVRQHTTVDRIWAAMQDIQRSFGQGMPEFQFFNESSRTYYQPCARTSLARLSRVFPNAHFQEYNWGRGAGGVLEAPTCLETGFDKGACLKVSLNSNLRRPVTLECFCFRGRSAEVEVLIGLPQLESRCAPSTRTMCLLIGDLLTYGNTNRDCPRITRAAYAELILYAHRASIYAWNPCEEDWYTNTLETTPDLTHFQSTVIPRLKAVVETSSLRRNRSSSCAFAAFKRIYRSLGNLLLDPGNNLASELIGACEAQGDFWEHDW